MNLRAWIYLLLAVIGIILPYSTLPAMLADGSYDLIEHFSQVFASPETAFFGWDLTVAALTFTAFLFFEMGSRKIRFWWVALLGTFLVGVSFGFPFFLFLRERAGLKALPDSSQHR